MAWLEFTIDTPPGCVDAVAAALTAGGFSELVLEDQQEFEDFLDQNRAYWDYIDESLQEKLQDMSSIKLYLEDTDEAGIAKLDALLAKLQKDRPLTVKRTTMADTDWEESWKENYPPQPLGEKLMVLPYWLDQSQAQGRIPVILDPGLTFGTGAHPSTQMVMEAMEQLLPQGGSCLDLGSGSGILSIAALRLGAARAVGVDIDPKAEDIARQNAAYNGFGDPRFTALTGNVTEDKKLMEQLKKEQYDLVLVNIVADVIIALAPTLPAFLSEKSVLILSGILDSRLEDVLAALKKAGLAVSAIREKEEWRCVCAGRSNA